MKSFNESLEALENRGTELSPDTDSDVGSFGKPEAEAPEAPEGDKLVLSIEGGIEIHIPVEVFQQMSDAMLGNGGMQPEAPVAPEAPEAPEAFEAPAGPPESPCDGSGKESKEESPCDDDNKKDCPFEKKDEEKSDEGSDEKKDSDEDKKDED